MRVLYVGNGAYKSRGAMYYDVGRKICNGFTRISNANNVYFISDRDTARAGNPLGSSKFGLGHCNKVFVDTCRNYQPDLILFCHADIIKVESLIKVRGLLPRVRMAQVNVDPLFSRHNIKMLQEKTPFLDATFVTTAGDILKQLSHSGCAVSYIPNPVDPSVESPRCYEHSDQENDVFWGCRLSKTDQRADNPRLDIPLYLEESGRIKVDYRGMNGKPAVFGAAYFKAIEKAKMGLNINQAGLIMHYDSSSTADSVYLYSSDRIAHYMGCGLMLFCHRDKERDSKLEELFAEDKELVFFTSKEELLEKITYYQENDNERREIAGRGWEKCHQHFNERLVAKYIQQVTFREALSENYAWPIKLF